MLRFIFFLLVVVFSSLWRLQGQSMPLRINVESSFLYIDDNDLRSLIDREHVFSESTILSSEDWSYKTVNFDYQTDLDANIWFKLPLEFQEGDKSYVLHLYNGLIPLFKLYYKNTNNQLVLVDSLGSLYPQSQRDNQYRDAVIELPLVTGRVDYYYMVNAKYYHGFDVAVRTNSNLFNYALKEYYLLGGFYGVLVLLLLYNLFLYFQVREKLYLIYSLYIFIAIVSSSSTDLIGYWFFWPNHPEWTKFLVDQSKWLLSASFVYYGVSFLQLKSKSAFWYKWTMISAFVYVVYNFLMINLYVPTIVSLFLVTLMTHLVVFWLAAFWCFKKGDKSSGIFLVGLTTMVIAFSGYYLRYWELIPVNVETSFMLHYGILAEIITLTYAISYRFKLEKEAKIEAYRVKAEADNLLIEQHQVNAELQGKVQRELEGKVSERTAKLELANDRLEDQAVKIKEMNDELSRMTQRLFTEKKQQQRARVWKKGLSKEEFLEVFPTKIECYHLINDLKNKDSYSCVKCQNDSFSEGTSLLSRRCTKCGYNESITTGTIFKGVKTPIEHNFYALYLLIESDLKMSGVEIAEKSSVSTKVVHKMKSQLEPVFVQKGSKNWVDYVIS